MTDTLIVPAQQKWVIGTAISGLVASVAVGNDLVKPLVYTASGLPLGISMNSSGVFSGTPVEAAYGDIIVTVTDADGTKETEGFTYVIVANAADARNSLSSAGFSVQPSACGLADHIPASPSIATLVSGASASQRAAYPDEAQSSSRIVVLPTDGTIFTPPNSIVGDVAGTATVKDQFGNTITGFPITGEQQDIAVTAISALSTTTKVFGLY